MTGEFHTEGWKGTRSKVRLAASIFAEAQRHEETSHGTSRPGEVGVALKGQGDGVIKSSLNIDHLVEVFLELGEEDAWCLPSVKDCLGSFTPLQGLHPAAEETPQAQRQQSRRSDDAANRKRRWLGNDGGLRAFPCEFVEQRYVSCCFLLSSERMILQMQRRAKHRDAGKKGCKAGEKGG
jgi:hypothetical protein